MFRTAQLATLMLIVATVGSANAQMPGAAAPRDAAPQRGSMQGMMQGGPMMDMHGMMGGREGGEESDAHNGIVGIALALEADKIGAPAHLAVARVEPRSPSYYAGIMRGDRLVAVDGQPVDGKSVEDVVKAIRGDVGSTVKLGLDRQGQAREVSLVRVEPQGRAGGRGPGGSRMDMKRMMDMMRMHQDMMGPGSGGEPNAGRPQ